MEYTITFTDANKGSFTVKPYTANGPASPAAATPLYNGAASASTSLILIGKGAFDYGEPIQKNLVHMLEHFANRSRPTYPIQGQLWYKNEDYGDPYWFTDPSKSGLYVYTGASWMQVVTADTPISGDINANAHKVTNVADATNDTDALNVRTGDYRYVNVGGDTMSGNLNMSTSRITNVGMPTDPHDAVNQAHCDSRYLQVAGGQLFGGINMNNNTIINVADPTYPQDALNLRSARSMFIIAGVDGSVDGGTY